MADTNDRCADCRYFDRHGKCRRYPPRVFMLADAGNTKFLRHLPDVKKDEYCGEFAPKSAD